VSVAAIQMLQSLSQANLHEMIALKISHQKAGATFIDKNSVEQTRENATSFINVYDASNTYIKPDRQSIPVATMVKVGNKEVADTSAIEAHAVKLIEGISKTVEAIRNEAKKIIEFVPPATADDDFGVDDVTAANDDAAANQRFGTGG